MDTILSALSDGSYAALWSKLGVNLFTGWLPRLLAAISIGLSMYSWIRRKSPQFGILFMLVTFLFAYAGTIAGGAS